MKPSFRMRMIRDGFPQAGAVLAIALVLLVLPKGKTCAEPEAAEPRGASGGRQGGGLARKLREAGLVSARILVLPAEAVTALAPEGGRGGKVGEGGKPSPERDEEPEDDGAAARPAVGSTPSPVQDAQPFLPRSFRKDPLQAKLNVAHEVDRFLREGSDGPARPESGNRSPSGMLLDVLDQNRKLEEETVRRRQEVLLEARRERALEQAQRQEVEAAGQGGERFRLFALARHRPEGTGRPGEQEVLVFDQDPEYDFATVRGGSAPFHVFDVDPSETILIELSGDEVARVKKKGKGWAWVQLESGLMGLVRNHHVEEADEFEILKYLALEHGRRVEEGEVEPGVPAGVRVSRVDGSYEVTSVNGRDEAIPGPADGMTAPEPETRRPRLLNLGRKK